MSNLAFFIDSTQYSANARQLIATVSALQSTSYKISIGVLGKPKPWSKLLTSLGADVYHLQSKGLWDLKALFNLRQWLQNQPATWVHLFSLKALDAVGLAAPNFLPRTILSGLPLTGFRFGFWRKRILKSVKKIFTPTLDFQNKLLALGFDQNKLAHLPPGIDPQPFTEINSPAFEKPYLFNSGPFHRDFDHRDALWSMDILKFVRSDLRLCLTGEGAELESLQSFSTSLMTHKNIRFLGATPFQEPWLNQAEIILVTNPKSGGYYSALEGLLSGRPVIASANPGMNEFIMDGKNGVLYAAGQRAELAKQIRLLLDEPEKAAAIAKSALESVQTRFSAKQYAAKLLQYYDDFK